MDTPAPFGGEESKPLILVVDDQRINIKMLEEQLTKAGYLVISAEDGDEAIRVTKSTVPDLILMDVMMPLRDGYEATRLIKQDPALAEVPVIFLTGRSQTKDVIQGFKAGGVDYIAKPFNSSELLVRVQTHLELRKARSKMRDMTADLENVHNNQKRMLSILASAMEGHLTNATKTQGDLRQRLGDSGSKVDARALLELAETADHELASVRQMLDNLIDWTKLQVDEMQARPRPTPLKPAFDRINEALEPIATYKKIKLQLTVGDDLQVVCDPGVLASVLRIALSNALKYTPKGGKVTIVAVPEGRDIRIEIKDTGVGIAPNFLERLFNNNDRTSSPGTDGEEGAGIGLELAQELIKRSGGEVAVDSRLGKGTNLTFRLPRSGA